MELLKSLEAESRWFLLATAPENRSGAYFLFNQLNCKRLQNRMKLGTSSCDAEELKF